MEGPNLRGWITVQQATERSGFSEVWIGKLLKQERIKGFRFNGRAWMVSEKDLDRYLRDRAPIGRPKAAASRKQ